MTTRKFSELRDELYQRSPQSKDRVHAAIQEIRDQLVLSELRGRAERTQGEIARAIGTSQSGVSRLERQQDLKVSTLRDYIAATGGRLRLVAEYSDYELEVSLGPEDRPAQHPREFRVIWQNTQTREFVHVGNLAFDGSQFAFAYTPEAELDDDFVAFADFPDFRTDYSQSELFGFFADRLPDSGRDDYDDVLTALGLTQRDATPVELLARSWGSSPHDTIQIVPEPTMAPDGTETRLFLASGLRHVDENHPERVADVVARLRPGQELKLHDEPDNEHNDRAVLLLNSGRRVGWVPNYLLDYLHKQRESAASVSVTVEHANSGNVSWHLRLLCRMTVDPGGAVEA